MQLASELPYDATLYFHTTGTNAAMLAKLTALASQALPSLGRTVAWLPGMYIRRTKITYWSYSFEH